ncbi:MAG TPA: hypothetical protein VNZ64_03415 [Candidatus Acidoferrum sp.]|nr:hypothetical protein [Candidatus Acidoferrum sp.]
MKPRKLIAVCAVLASLLLCSTPARAEEKPGSTLGALSSTTFGGYVDAGASWDLQPTSRNGFRIWLRSFFNWVHLRKVVY